MSTSMHNSTNADIGRIEIKYNINQRDNCCINKLLGLLILT